MEIVHVTPLNDLIEHEETDGALCDCPCGPDVNFIEGGIVVTHHSLDGRELREPDYEG